MTRAIAYVDGFNLFHGITERTKTRGCRWLNLRSLLQDELLPGHTLERVIFFTSVPPWSNSKAHRHETYIAALESAGVEVVRGRFQEDLQECYGKCGQQFKIFMEKHTDVNIATRMLSDAVLCKMDWAYLVSGDADQSPTLKALRLLAPKGRTYVLFPPNRHSADLKALADRSQPLGYKKIKDHLFPDLIQVPGRYIRKPTKWVEEDAALEGDPTALSSGL